jgi:hypothetical protein
MARVEVSTQAQNAPATRSRKSEVPSGSSVPKTLGEPSRVKPAVRGGGGTASHGTEFGAKLLAIAVGKRSNLRSGSATTKVSTSSRHGRTTRSLSTDPTPAGPSVATLGGTSSGRVSRHWIPVTPRMTAASTVARSVAWRAAMPLSSETPGVIGRRRDW